MKLPICLRSKRGGLVWDLPKALGLFLKSNPPLLEWLQSPIVYTEDSSLRRRLLELLSGYYLHASNQILTIP